MKDERPSLLRPVHLGDCIPRYMASLSARQMSHFVDVLMGIAMHETANVANDNGKYRDAH